GPHEDRRARAGSARKLGRTRAFVISRVEERNGERKAEPRVVPLNVDHDRERSIAAQPKRRWRRARVKVEGRCYKLAGTLEAHVERVRNRANEAEPTRFCFGATETAGENPAGVVHPFLGGGRRIRKLPFGEHHQEAAYFVGNYYLMAPAPTWYRFSARVTFPRSRSSAPRRPAVACGKCGNAFTISGTAFAESPCTRYISSRRPVDAKRSMFWRAIHASWFQHDSATTDATPNRATRRTRRRTSTCDQISMPNATNASETPIMYTRAYRRAAVYPYADS